MELLTPKRFWLPVLLALALLSGQHAGIIHAFNHALAGQPDNQHLPQSPACEQCAVYAQLGSAIGSVSSVLLLLAAIAAAPGCGRIFFHSILLPAASARGPPR